MPIEVKYADNMNGKGMHPIVLKDYVKKELES